MFISFEGVDGCGKSTQVRLLAEALRRRGREVVTLREPGGTEAAERVRELLADPETPLEPVAELLLFCAARADLVARRVRPALAAGATVICDRFTDSTLAYQGVARGLGEEMVTRLNDVATDGLKPDRTFYLRFDPEQALARAIASAEGDDRFEAEGVAFQRKVARAYDDLAAAQPERIVVIEAAGAPDEVHSRILAVPLLSVTDSHQYVTKFGDASGSGKNVTDSREHFMQSGDAKRAGGGIRGKRDGD